MNTPGLSACPKCGGALPGDAPQGLCPRCLAAMNLATETAFTGAAAAAAPAPLTAAELAPHFPQLEILGDLGRGGMGVVYKARQRTLNRLVALKLLAPERANNPSFAERFAREAQALAALNHPNIVAIHDFGQAGGFYYLLMEFVDGVNLRQAMKAGRFTPEQALAVVPPVCEALQYAHEHGIVHRDIKPENLLLDKDGRVKIADFGIAKMLEPAGSEAGLEESQPAGTPQYMAPEQREHRRTDHRADIYSLGVVLYEMLTGELPGKPLEPPSRKVQIDVRLDEVVLRALERQPELRYQTAADVKTVIETMAATSPTEARAASPPGFLKSPGGAPAPHARKPSVVRWQFLALLVGVLSFAAVVPVSWIFRHETVRETESAGPISAVRTWSQPAPAGSMLPPKTFALEGFTNQLGYVRVTTHTWFAPGESCQAWLVHADGRREEVGSLESVFYHGGQESCLCGWSWWLPPPFDTNRADEVVTQLRERWRSRLLACPPGQPVTVFTLTNETGARVSGEVQFNRTEPDPTRTAVAEVRVRNQMGNLLFFTSKVPAGYSLHIRGAGTELRRAEATLSRSASRGSHDEHCSWIWPDTEYRAALAATAAEQMRTLFAQGPLRVTNGRPRTVFSVTNSAGDVFAGQFELRGPAGATLTRPAPATPTWIARVLSLRHKSASSGLSAAANLLPKTFALEGFTNQMGSAMVRTAALLAPGESCQAWLVHADGRREEANSLESVFRHSEKESGGCNWSWTLPPPFETNRTDEVVAQLRERWQSRLLACPPGQPVTLFTLTNESGARVSGEVQFNRTEPDPTERAVAEVRARHQMGKLLFFTSKVPAGYALHIRGAGTLIQTAHATLSRSSARYSTDETGSWMWTDREFRPEISATAAAQMRALFARGPLRVTNGQPRTVFSVTNSAGDVFAGQFELRGPAGTTGVSLSSR